MAVLEISYYRLLTDKLENAEGDLMLTMPAFECHTYNPQRSMTFLNLVTCQFAEKLQNFCVLHRGSLPLQAAFGTFLSWEVRLRLPGLELADTLTILAS